MRGRPVRKLVRITRDVALNPGGRRTNLFANECRQARCAGRVGKVADMVHQCDECVDGSFLLFNPLTL